MADVQTRRFTQLGKGQIMKGHWLHEWTDETSMYDPAGEFSPGLDCYMRKYRLWVPNRIKPTQEEALEKYIDKQQGIPSKWA